MKRSTIRMTVDEPNDAIIKEIIKQHTASKNITLGLYQRYDQEGVPIQSRTFKDALKPNNKLSHDYRGYVINQVVGYLWGNPISYQINKVRYGENEYEAYDDALEDFNTLNVIDDLDSELGKLASICGYASRLVYIDTDGVERVMNISPWEAVFIESKNKTTHAVRYYTEKYYEGKEEKERTLVEWYDSTNVSFYVKSEKSGNSFVLDDEGVKPHLFDHVPLILFQNNDEERGDFEKVEMLIDAYDKNRSDSTNEVETFANAYMAFKGVTIDSETINEMKQTGGIEIDENGDVFFITKNINDTFVENTRKNLNEDIHKFSASVDMNDEKFSGASQSGESRKWKLIELENKAGTKARKFGVGLREQFKVLCSAWSKKGIALNYLDVFWEFKRNLPIDLLYIGESISKLKGLHSDQTLLGLIPYIDDIEYEQQLMEQEKSAYIDLDNLPPDEKKEVN
ncbi:phage portal protein [Sporosarcina sp. FSL K6-1508]|uniref:phage portal protein n=1 Tax=Sporosarcina sp. FSL K6-1508 TaxID=2921553 RepID=UPI0030FB545B